MRLAASASSGAVCSIVPSRSTTMACTLTGVENLLPFAVCCMSFTLVCGCFGSSRRSGLGGGRRFFVLGAGGFFSCCHGRGFALALSGSMRNDGGIGHAGINQLPLYVLVG